MARRTGETTPAEAGGGHAGAPAGQGTTSVGLDHERAGGARRTSVAWLACLLVLAIAGAGAWYVLGWGAGQGAAPAEKAEVAGPARVPVEAAAVRAVDFPVHLNGLGTVRAFNTVLVRSRVDGEVVRIAFEEGQTVREGDLLAEIDPRPYQAALDQALARKAQNEAALGAGRLDLDRTRQLAGRAFATQQTLDQQTANVASQTAGIAGDQAAIENARTQLGYTTIRSPLTGRTGLRLVDQGNIVRAGDATGIVEVVQLQPISVLFTAPEGQLREIAAAMRAGPVKVAALGPDGKTPLEEGGTLALINNEIDAASGTVRLKATFANAEDRLWPGLSVNTRLLVRTLPGALAVPEDAVQRGPNELFAYVVSEAGTAEKRVLKVGPILDGQAVIEDGLKAGERVVTAGHSRLKPGAAVEVAPAPPAPADPARQANRAADATGSTGTPPPGGSPPPAGQSPPPGGTR